MKLLILMVLCLLTAATCKEKSNTSAQNVKHPKSKQKVFIDSKGNHYNAFGDIPPHLRTPEQMLYVKSLNDVLLNGVVAENNHMILKLSKAECLAKGMTEETYNELKTNLKDNNHFFDSLGNKKIAEMVEDMHRSLKGDTLAKGVSIP